MAKGAAVAGCRNGMAVSGDSTFYHSGLTGLVDCVADQAKVTVIIMDNSTVAMTGGQQTMLQSARLPQVVEGLGVAKDHIRVLDAFRRSHDGNVEVLKEELAFEGPSVIITVRECVETVKKRLARRKQAKEAAAGGDR
ncbi:MAG: indolepyruvate ferredoxin oxidoreductase, partial [Spirochaetaceae bacterium]|nr:indolepyruvate ferredoxin oxidoreductase [Spirochaetaceae bacterium]